MSDNIKEWVNEYLRTTAGIEKSDTGYQVGESSIINVLVVGRSQSGKTTLVNSLKDTAYASYLTGFSDTVNVTHHPLVVRDKSNDKYYQINLIDTIGLGEASRDSASSRPDDEILKLAAKFIRQEITSLNAVIFVSKIGDTHLHDLPVFTKLMEFLGEPFKTNTMMILTHCENNTPEKTQQFVDSIQNTPSSRALGAYCTLGIHPHGTLNFEQLEQFRDQRQREIRRGILEQKLELVIPMRRKILELLIGQSGKQKPVKDLEEIMKLIKKEQDDLIQKELQKRGRRCVIM